MRLSTERYFLKFGLFALFVGVMSIGIDAKQKKSFMEIKSNTNKVSNIEVPKDKDGIKITLQNNADNSYLWIIAYGKDIRKIEHGARPLKIIVNGIVLDPVRSILQNGTYRYPVHPRSYMISFSKYLEDEKAWSFKYDVDFIMNNNTRGGKGKWGTYTTIDYNHWYTFDVKGVAKKGDNSIEIGIPKKSRFYAGCRIGELAFLSSDEVKAKIKAYNEKQIKISPEELSLPPAVAIPDGKAPVLQIRNGYIVKDGKPFLQLLIQGFSNFVNAPKNLLYMNWGNDLQLSPWMVDEVGRYEFYLTSDWDKQDIIPRIALEQAAKVYNSDILGDLRYAAFNLNDSWTSKAVAKRIPDMLAIDSKGQKCSTRDNGGGLFPNLGSKLYQEYMRQVIAVMGKNLKGHPGIFANSAHEELRWRCNGSNLPSQCDSNKQAYRQVLLEKYKTIETLNSKWETKYKAFTEIEPPKTKEQSANFINFQIYRASVLQEFSQVLYSSLKKAFPDKLVTGERSGIQWFYGGWTAGESWFLNSEWADIRTIGGGGTALARAAQRYYGNSGRNFALQNDICFRCQYKYINRPYKPFWTLPSTHDRYGLEIEPSHFFSRIIHDMFEGVRCSFYYSYDSDRHHLIHNQARYSAMRTESNYKNWEIDLSKLKGLPDIVIPEQSESVTQANGLCYKLAPLLLPSKVDQGKLALLYTRRSSLIGWTFKPDLKGPEGGPITRFEWQYLHKLLEHMHMPFEVITEDTFNDDIENAKVLIAGYWATMGSKDMAEKIKDFVSKGNIVVFYPDAFCYDWNTTKNLDCSPGYGLDKLFCARIKRKISGKSVKIRITNDIGALKKGDIFQARGLVTPLEKLERGKVIAELADTGEPVVVSANNNKTYYIGFVPGISYSTEMENAKKIRELFSEIIKNSEIKKPVKIKKDKNSYLIYTRILHGKDYWLLTFLNEYWNKQDVHAKLNFLPEGKFYDITDVTDSGKPVILGQKRIVNDLKENGIKLSLEALRGRVLLIRPSDTEVIVDCPEYELGALAIKKDIDIVLSINCSEKVKGAIKKLCKILQNKGSNVRIIKADKIPIKEIDTSLKEDGYPIGKFKNKVLDTANNLILIGSSDNNKLIKVLCTPGNYTYDKVLEDVSLSYPGFGRGVIQVAESVNKPYYCPTDKSREAILIGGSNEEGTIKAVEKFINLLE